MKAKRAFNVKPETDQRAELDRLLFEKVFARERERMLYFFLAYPQRTVVVKVGEKQAEKDFIGYEFSNRRGHEGIKMYRDADGKLATRLYDNDDHLNPEKASSYVYKAFLGDNCNDDIAADLSNNISRNRLANMITFDRIDFIKNINLTLKKRR